MKNFALISSNSSSEEFCLWRKLSPFGLLNDPGILPPPLEARLFEPCAGNAGVPLLPIPAEQTVINGKQRIFMGWIEITSGSSSCNASVLQPYKAHARAFVGRVFPEKPFKSCPPRRS
ncbi:MAG: hypothetical protein AB1921_13180 [Thermodesulfobacteriota bacterium]